MNFLNPTTPSPELLERRKKLRAKGRKHYIFSAQACFVGACLLRTLWNWHAEYGWHTPPRRALSHEFAHIAFSLALYLAAGYFFGVAMWKKMGFEDSTEAAPKS
jgi:hypothetical protein